MKLFVNRVWEFFNKSVIACTLGSVIGFFVGFHFSNLYQEIEATRDQFFIINREVIEILNETAIIDEKDNNCSNTIDFYIPKTSVWDGLNPEQQRLFYTAAKSWEVADFYYAVKQLQDLYVRQDQFVFGAKISLPKDLRETICQKRKEVRKQGKRVINLTNTLIDNKKIDLIKILN